jgi:beta-glucanase (GH16 family)
MALAFLIAAAVAASASASAATSFCSEAGWTSLWADEFDTLDVSSWTASNGTVEDDSKCRGAMCLADNVAVRDGALVLTARREQVGWANITTGAVNSNNKRYFGAAAGRPVRFCIQSKLPGTPATGAGYWPALWLMPNTAACWPDNGELDLMEEINGDGVEHFTYHVSPRNATACHGGPVQESAGASVPITTMATAWHEYAVEIALGQFAFVVDGLVVWNSTSRPDLPVHDVPWYVILNFAIGGPWPKPPNAATVFPAEMLVDYVRVSQLGSA